MIPSNLKNLIRWNLEFLKTWNLEPAQSIYIIWVFDDFKKPQNGGDMVDGADIDIFGFLAIKPVAVNGFSNPMRFWNEI
jgi:hypothetical protein